MEERDAAVAAGLRARATHALRQRHNWEQLAKFCAVGASGYIVNLAVYTALLDGADLHYRLAATGSFLVAVTNNYLWNRLWTFRHQRGHVGYQGIRFLIVSVVVYGANLALLSFSVSLWFFNHGNVFASAPLVYPPLVYLIVRCTWIGLTGRAVHGRVVWPAWVLLGA